MTGYNQYETLYDPSFPARLPELFKNGDSITQVCVALDIARSTYYKWKDDHEQFRIAANKGEAIAQAKMEKLLLKGIKGKVKNFQVTGMIFLLKSRFRDVYADEKKEDKSAADSLLEQIILGKIKVEKAE